MRCVKRLGIVVLILVCGTSACKDTEPRQVWRTIEPRLTQAEWQPFRAVPATPPSTDEPCPDLIDTHKDALRLLESRPQCTDSAIAALRVFAHSDAHALSDIAAAYYVRAQREQQDSDLLRALEAAERATAAMPDDATALFNLALIQESLGFSNDAMTSWNALLSNDRSGWANEARDHLHRLRAPIPHWNRGEVAAALKRRDRTAVRKLIAPFPSPAMDYFEQDVLKSKDPGAANLLAEELSRRLGGDPYAPDAARAMTHPRDSPLRLAAEMDRVLHLPYRAGATATSLQLLEPLAEEAHKRHYEYLGAKIQALRAYIFMRESRHLDAITNYDAAFKVFERFGDTEKVASIHRSRCGSYRELGQSELAWHEGLQALRYVSRTVHPRIRNVIFGEGAKTAAELHFPAIALRYENLALRMVQDAFREQPPEGVEDYKTNVAARRRSRADVELQLDRYKDASDDLAEAKRLAEKPKDATVLSAIQAQIHEIDGRSLLRVNPMRAVAAFSAALAIVPQDEARTFRASLYAERAEAAQLAGRDGDAQRDLQNALRELRGEESQMLARRRPGEGEPYWSAYFNRFRETYDRLIRQLVDRGQWEPAFDYAERSRAYEPLNLILQRGVAPESFRRLVPHGEPMSLRAVQPYLDEGTFLLQYTVLEDRTETWIVSRDGASHITQRARRKDVERWSDELQRASRQRDDPTFRRALQPPFAELLRRPLRDIAKLQNGRVPRRLVIVADGAMHGLPFAGLYDFDTKQHLIEKMPIELAPSATLYVFSLLRDEELSSSEPPTALLFGDPNFNSQLDLARGLKRLPRAKSEVERIAGAFGALAVVRTGDAATVPEFLALAKNKAIVHIAAHAIVNPSQPWHSVLLLAPSKGDSGAIDAEELLRNLTLDRTRLVVLSACSSAGGLPVGSEGVAPLVRPLITAGVPAVMGTLWDVEDATAERLSVSFHRHYGQGDDAAEALRAAQLEMLRSGNRGLQSLLAWAPFQVIGHASSPFESTQERQSNGGTHLGVHRTNPFHRDDGIHPQ